jgi:hypothetical protein
LQILTRVFKVMMLKFFLTMRQSTEHLRVRKHKALHLDILECWEVTIMEYVEHFKALAGVVETYGGTNGNEPGLIKAQLLEQGALVADVNTPDVDKLKKVLAMCCDSYLSCMILQGSDNSKFYQLKTDLTNNMAKERDNFPKTIIKTTCLLNDYKVPTRQQCVKDPTRTMVWHFCKTRVALPHRQ